MEINGSIKKSLTYTIIRICQFNSNANRFHNDCANVHCCSVKKDAKGEEKIG